MSAIVHPSLTNSQPLRVRRRLDGMLGILGLWRRRARERQALANLTERELADFGATTADVYRELTTPFWRSESPR